MCNYREVFESARPLSGRAKTSIRKEKALGSRCRGNVKGDADEFWSRGSEKEKKKKKRFEKEETKKSG